MASLAPADLWDKIRRNLPRLPFVREAVAAYYCALDPRTPATAKGILIGALVYFVSPIDLVPDVLAVVGFTDDAAVLAAAIATVRRHLLPEHVDKARATLERIAR